MSPNILEAPIKTVIPAEAGIYHVSSNVRPYMKTGYVYIITNTNHEILYIGVTSNLPKRIWEHKNKVVEWFSKRYCLNKLVYYETYDNIEDAIQREKCMKKWNRAWKVRRIDEVNINWNDLYDQIT